MVQLKKTMETFNKKITETKKDDEAMISPNQIKKRIKIKGKKIYSSQLK